MLLPLKAHRWVWRSRKLAALARILRGRHPHIGDRLLGIIELAERRDHDQDSPALCRAAIDQVAHDTQDECFRDAVPRPRHRLWAGFAFAALALAVAAVAVPGAGLNALERWVAPWGDTARYTFARVEPLPQRRVVALGEPFVVTAKLTGDAPWRPAIGSARYGRQSPLSSDLTDGEYTFEFPGQTTPAALVVSIGDAVERIDVVPLTRPELEALHIDVELPAYLERPDLAIDARGGTASLLKGSRASFEATVNRHLARATIDDASDKATVAGGSLSSSFEVSGDATLRLHWTDVEGLSPREPFDLRIRALDDEPPMVRCQGLVADQVILDSEVLSFDVVADDDFGVRAVGLEWSEVEHRKTNPDPRRGEYELAPGGATKTDLTARGTFAAADLGIEPQPILLRAWVEDYRPGAERVFSSTYRVFVLSAKQHMIWLTQQLGRWERQVLEVRDEETRLLDRNQELRDLDAAAMAQADTQREIERQAAAERANGRRLRNLTEAGKRLISQAARNEEFNTATLEKWARTVQSLEQLAKSRMPSVASLLDEAAEMARKSEAAPSDDADPQSGDGKKSPPSVASGPPPEGKGKKSAQSKPSKLPSINDTVAAANRDAEPGDEKKPSNAQSQSSGSFGLPTTTLADNSASSQQGNAQCPPAKKVDEAVEEQEALLAEFNRVMKDLQDVLNNLRASTFVKRLKQAAGEEKDLAGGLEERLGATFGKLATDVRKSDRATFDRLKAKQEETATQVSYIRDDLAAYFARTKETKFDTVQKEMQKTGVVTGMKDMIAAVDENRTGETIAMAEHWVDQLDRWAEILVGPG